MPTAEEEIGALLIQRGLTVATAESTTGGYVGHLLNNVPGSSKYFIGSVVAYSSRPKTVLLKVPEAILRDAGSVSAQCALAMAQGVREVMGADIAVSETGVAGPTGGSASRPVGTVFVAIACKDGYELVERSVFAGDRLAFKRQTAEAMLALMRHYLSRDKIAQG